MKILCRSNIQAHTHTQLPDNFITLITMTTTIHSTHSVVVMMNDNERNEMKLNVNLLCDLLWTQDTG